MITKTSKEVFLHALQLAGVNNLNFTDFFNTTALLNNLYRRIYEKIASSDDGYYDREIVFKGNTFYLPSDIWMIKRVIRVDDNGNESRDVLRAPGQTPSYDQYFIRNNVLRINTNAAPTIKIIYVPKPQTITVPQNPELLDISVDKILLKNITGMDDEGFYFTDSEDSLAKYYDFETKAITTVTSIPNKPTTFRYLNGDLTIDVAANTFTYLEDGTETAADIKEYIEAADDSGIKRVEVSNPYMAVTFNDDKIFIFNGFDFTSYNILAYKGKETLGEALALYTDDYTGKGLIFLNKQNNKLYYTSFVPDTILNYPEQADFSLLEIELALNLAQMAGTPSEWLEKEYARANAEFMAQLQRTKASVLRVNNVRGQTYYGVV